MAYTAAARTLEVTRERKRAIGVGLCVVPALYFAATAFYACLHAAEYASAPPQFLRYLLVPALLSAGFLACAAALPNRAKFLVGVNACAILAALFAYELLMTARMIPVHLGNFGQMNSAEAEGKAEHFLPGLPLKGVNRRLETQHLSEAMLGGLPQQETLLCTREGAPITYPADRFGFNNPDSAYERNVEVVVLGDSFVEGFCLPPGRDFISRLREIRPGSVGFGTRGNGPLLELAVLRRFGQGLRPKHVVVAFFEGNDWRNLGLELQIPWLRSALRDDVQAGAPPAPEPVIGALRSMAERHADRRVTFTDLLVRTKILRNVSALHFTSLALGLAYPRAPAQHPEFEAVLAKMKGAAEEMGADFKLLYIPQPGRYLGLLPQEFVADQLRNKVLDAAARAGVEVVDLVPIFREEAAPMRFYHADGHFNEQGAAVAAEALAERLNSSVAALE